MLNRKLLLVIEDDAGTPVATVIHRVELALRGRFPDGELAYSGGRKTKD